MAFTKEVSRVPTSIGDISIVITDYEAGTDEVRYSVQIKDVNDAVMINKRGSLVSHLTATEISQLQNIANSVRTKAQAFL
ncbi:MAG: hypothetical protein GY928_27825 [Colwellia sp.]|nr:hypothetical protein [Colwellia sp.]